MENSRYAICGNRQRTEIRCIKMDRYLRDSNDLTDINLHNEFKLISENEVYECLQITPFTA